MEFQSIFQWLPRKIFKLLLLKIDTTNVCMYGTFLDVITFIQMELLLSQKDARDCTIETWKNMFRLHSLLRHFSEGINSLADYFRFLTTLIKTARFAWQIQVRIIVSLYFLWRIELFIEFFCFKFSNHVYLLLSLSRNFLI